MSRERYNQNLRKMYREAKSNGDHRRMAIYARLIGLNKDAIKKQMTKKKYTSLT